VPANLNGYFTSRKTSVFRKLDGPLRLCQNATPIPGCPGIEHAATGSGGRMLNTPDPVGDT